jgi:hypothetical protein
MFVIAPSQKIQSHTVRKHVVTRGFLQKLQSRFDEVGRAVAVPGREDNPVAEIRGIIIPEFDEDMILIDDSDVKLLIVLSV